MIYDVILRNGMVYDGSGSDPIAGDVAIQGDQIAAVGNVPDANAKVEIDVEGLAIAPGFINMLSWAVESLIADGRSQSDIRQGVTLEVMGEGTSMGPLSPAMKASGARGILNNRHIQYDVEWTTLGEYLEFLVRRGVSTNVASFVGTGTLRTHVMGYEDREPTPSELDTMRRLVLEAMEEGAVGMSAALIYPPAAYANTEEIIALAEVVAEYEGLYISHLRSEGAFFLEALDELVQISDKAGVRAEVYHLKAAGPQNWHKIDAAIERIESLRAKGKPITADMYTYNASGTSLDACLPPWAHEGGKAKLIERLKDTTTRDQIKQDMMTPSTTWENMWLNSPSAEGVLLAMFSNPDLKGYEGKTLREVAEMRGVLPEDTLLDLVAEDGKHIFTIYSHMDEENVRKQIALPWVSFCSDAESLATEGVFLKSKPHPRAYGSFARVLGRYVRDEGRTTLQDAIRRLTSFPAQNLNLDRRGLLASNYFADVVVFDPLLIEDRATYTEPHQYATGMKHVFVNGEQVLKDGEHTGLKPGRVVRNKFRNSPRK
jgi:N-acyl-D-amino-acid deacylase